MKKEILKTYTKLFGQLSKDKEREIECLIEKNGTNG